MLPVLPASSLSSSPPIPSARMCVFVFRRLESELERENEEEEGKSESEKKCEMNACVYRLGLPYLIQRLTGVLLTRVKACSKKATFYVRNGFQKSNSKITHQQHQV